MITFHPYGLTIAVAILCALFLVEKKAKKIAAFELIKSMTFPAIIAGFIGARIWHVVTDYAMYVKDPFRIFFVWQGGLSVIGGVFFGLLTLYIISKKNQFSLLQVTDVIVFGLPIGQAIGRIGNYLNQELYGLPTALPWKIYIDSGYRSAHLQRYEFFHPLFAYEAILTVLFGVWIWFFDSKVTDMIGKGWYTYLYILYYAVGRFFLDFLRPDKSISSVTGLGINQVVLLVVILIAINRLNKIYENR